MRNLCESRDLALCGPRTGDLVFLPWTHQDAIASLFSRAAAQALSERTKNPSSPEGAKERPSAHGGAFDSKRPPPCHPERRAPPPCHHDLSRDERCEISASRGTLRCAVPERGPCVSPVDTSRRDCILVQPRSGERMQPRAQALGER